MDPRAILRSYASILFSRSPVVGALLCAATATSPRLFVFGLGSVVFANAVARALHLDEHAVAEGQFGYNALLVGLGLGGTFLGYWPAVPVLVLAVIATVLLTASFRAALGASGLPSLSLPFLAVYYLLLSASPLTHLAFGPYAIDGVTALPDAFALFLRSLGSIFFLPHVDAGLFVLVAMMVHSRISTMLAAIAFAAVLVLDRHVLSLPEGSMLHVLGYNTMLTAIALGGVWFVPSKSSLSLSLVGVLLCVMVTVGSLPVLARVGVPAMILPFNVTSILMLYAMRQRTRDGHPDAVFSAADSPEAIVEEQRSRAARFFARYLVRFRLPFRGAWVCTQGNDGEYTHKDEWRDGLDFEVKGRDGALFSGSGADVRDFHAYGLPVVAAADGVVAKVIDGLPDNAVGRMDLQHNWGNLVVLYHALGLYSVVAHLKPGSIKVREGQNVREGEVLGACGNSGRSPTPHLHFQLQGTAIVGAPTLPVHFHHVIGDELRREMLPRKDDVVRAIDPDPALAELFEVPIGSSFVLGDEKLHAEVGLLGERSLRSEAGATLTFEKGDALLVVLDAKGARKSVLHLLFAAMPRVPFDGAMPTWSDVLPRQRFRSPAARVLADLLALFREPAGIEMRYEMHREASALVITGASLEQRAGVPLLSTRLEVERGVGVTVVEVTFAGKTRRATRSSS